MPSVPIFSTPADLTSSRFCPASAGTKAASCRRAAAKSVEGVSWLFPVLVLPARHPDCSAISHKPAVSKRIKRPIPNGFDEDFSSDGRFLPKTLRREMFRCVPAVFAARRDESRGRECNHVFPSIHARYARFQDVHRSAAAREKESDPGKAQTEGGCLRPISRANSACRKTRSAAPARNGRRPVFASASMAERCRLRPTQARSWAGYRARPNGRRRWRRLRSPF